MFGEKIVQSNSRGASFLEDEQQEFEISDIQEVYPMELEKNWTASKRVHAAERGRLEQDSNQIQSQYKSLFFQTNLKK